MGALFAAFAAWLGPLLGAAGLFTMRTFLCGLFLGAVGVVLHNCILAFLGYVLTWVVSQAGGISGPSGVTATMSLTGVTAYVCGLFQVPQCVSILVSCVGVRIAIKLIPFIRL